MTWEVNLQARFFIPPVPYFTKMDLYMIACILFVMISTVQTVVVRVLLSKEDGQEVKEKVSTLFSYLFGI